MLQRGLQLRDDDREEAPLSGRHSRTVQLEHGTIPDADPLRRGIRLRPPVGGEHLVLDQQSRTRERE